MGRKADEPTPFVERDGRRNDVTLEEIEARASAIYARVGGDKIANWLQAESELVEEAARRGRKQTPRPAGHEDTQAAA